MRNSSIPREEHVRLLALELFTDREAQLREEAQERAREQLADEANDRFSELLEEEWAELDDERAEAWQECLAEARSRLT